MRCGKGSCRYLRDAFAAVDSEGEIAVGYENEVEH